MNRIRKMIIKNALPKALSIATLLVVQASYAQPILEEVVVTARKKASGEAVQDVPIAITAVSGDIIENRLFMDLTDVGSIAPNVQLSAVGTLPGTANFFIRGMGVFGSIPSDESAVGVFLDGIYLGVNSGAVTNLFDVESVEILRGPQGTLFGRNVTGGAVSVKSGRPTEEFEGKARVGAGNESQGWVDLALGGRLSEKWLGKVAAGYRTNGDYFDNTTGPDRGEASSFYVRPTAVYNATDDLSVTFIGQYEEFDGDGVISKNVALTDVLDDHQLATDLDGEAEYDVKHLIADVDWNVGDKGNVRIIAGWRETFTGAELDGDGQPKAVPKVHSNAPWAVYQEQTSLELRYNTPIMESSDLTVGVYYLDQDVTYEESRLLNLGYETDKVVGAGAELDHSSWAIFGQSDIGLSEVLTLIVGARYTSEEKSAEIGSFGFCDDFGSNCDFDFVDDDGWSFVSGNTTLKWDMSDNSQSYVGWTRSFRSGGYNLRNTLPASPGPYDEEQVDAFEIGVKSDLLDGRMRVNAAIFHNEYSDLQRTIIIDDPNTGIRQEKANAADATIQGLEIELNAIITDSFRIDLSAGFIDAEYDSFKGGDPSNDLPNVPETNGNITLLYSHALGDGEIEARGAATYTDSQYGDVANSPEIQLDSYTVVDGSLSYTFPGQSLRISLWGKNLTDEEYTNFALSGLNALWAIAPPRRYGVELNYAF
jgi:iron complex outermembrane receptor protein